MSNKFIYIQHIPTGGLLCGDGRFRSCYSACGTLDDTLVYRTIGHALRRLNTRKPGKAIRKDMIADIQLMVNDGNITFYLNKNGDLVPRNA